MSRKAKITMTVSIDGSLVERIGRLAAATGQSRSSWVESQLRNLVDDEEIGVKALTDPVVGPALVGMFKDRDVLRGFAKLVTDQLSDKQLGLFAERVSKLTHRRPRGQDAQRKNQVRR